MANFLLKTNAKTVTDNDRKPEPQIELDPVTVSIANAPKKHRLVARWLKDENFQLSCYWVIED